MHFRWLSLAILCWTRPDAARLSRHWWFAVGSSSASLRTTSSLSPAFTASLSTMEAGITTSRRCWCSPTSVSILSYMLPSIASSSTASDVYCPLWIRLSSNSRKVCSCLICCTVQLVVAANSNYLTVIEISIINTEKPINDVVTRWFQVRWNNVTLQLKKIIFV